MFGIYDDKEMLIDWAFDRDGIDKLFELYNEEIEEGRFTFTYDAPQTAEHVRTHILNNYRSVFMNVNTEECVQFLQSSRGFLEVKVEGILGYRTPLKDLKCSEISETVLLLNDLSFFNVDEWEVVE